MTGTVTGADGGPLESASVYIESMSLGVLTNAQGRYLLIVPASRASGQTVTLQRAFWAASRPPPT